MEKSEGEEFFTLDVSLFYGKFDFFGKDEQEVRGKVHKKEEEYRSAKHEIVPLTASKGPRIYVMMKPYIQTPSIFMTVELYGSPKQTISQGDPIGKVVSSHEGRMQEHELGIAQAWYYPADRVIVLWECLIEERFRAKGLDMDGNILKLWTGFEGFLTEQFPSAQRIATTHRDPAYNDETYQIFLQTLGYSPMAGAPAAWEKKL